MDIPIPSLDRPGRRLFQSRRPVSSPFGEVYFRRPENLRAGCQIELLSGGGETFAAMLEAIAGARRSVHLETFTLRADVTGQRFHAALLDAAERGVEVRVMYDSVGSLGLGGGFVDSLREHGVEVVEFRPIAPWRQRWGLNSRDHQKLLVIDAEVAFIGGTNISDEYCPDGDNWHDVHSRITGPVVGDLARLFRRNWLRGGGVKDDDLVHDPEPIPGHEGTRIEAIDNAGFLKRGMMHRDYKYAINQAKGSVRLMNAYFIPDRSLRRALRRATSRGVDVRVIVPGTSDVAMVKYASRHLYRRLLKWGVKIYEFEGPMMHAKCGLIDGTWATIGSYNLDLRSMIHNLEAGVVCLSVDFAEALGAEFAQIQSQCRQVHRNEWANRPWWNLVLEWVSFRFRYWL